MDEKWSVPGLCAAAVCGCGGGSRGEYFHDKGYPVSNSALDKLMIRTVPGFRGLR